VQSLLSKREKLVGQIRMTKKVVDGMRSKTGSFYVVASPDSSTINSTPHTETRTPFADGISVALDGFLEDLENELREVEKKII